MTIEELRHYVDRWVVKATRYQTEYGEDDYSWGVIDAFKDVINLIDGRIDPPADPFAEEGA